MVGDDMRIPAAVCFARGLYDFVLIEESMPDCDSVTH